ncbi:MAG: hypothetical protein MNPFHGCM_02273 [Gemmatimonadaceae bacterium]|nr:hypothetical protein [Gemmatimonadaceae bacterium]
MAEQDREHPIGWGQARELINAHRSAAGVTASTSEGGFGGAFKKADVIALLSQANCQFLRIYYAKRANGSPTLVLIGVDADRKDMVDGIVLDNHYPCPPWCPPGGAGEKA